jgi:serine/threonine-protein kinase RsbW
MRRDLTLEMRSDPKLLCASRALLKQYLERLGFARDRVDEIVLAVDEGITNAIRHGYDSNPDETVSLWLGCDADWLQIDIVDGGKAAPAERVARKEMKPPSEDELTPGGLGVQLIYEVCDDVSFEPRDGQGNHVRMRIRRPDSPGGPANPSGKDR